MNKNKNISKMIKTMEENDIKLQQEWANKRGIKYPLSMYHEKLCRNEHYIQQRFNYVAEQFMKAEESKKEINQKDVHAIQKYWTNFFKKDFFNLGDYYEKNNAIRIIESAVDNGHIGNTYIDFGYYVSYGDDKHRKFQKFDGYNWLLGQSIISASCYKCSGQIFLNGKESIYLKVYLGDVGVHKRGFVFFSSILGSVNVILEVDEFYMLSTTITNPVRFVFTLFNAKENILFLKDSINSIKNIDLFDDKEDIYGEINHDEE